MKAYVVEKEALSHNIELLQKMANGVPIWAVLKGNGYGIGVLPPSGGGRDRPFLRDRGARGGASARKRL